MIPFDMRHLGGKVDKSGGAKLAFVALFHGAFPTHVGPRVVLLTSRTSLPLRLDLIMVQYQGMFNQVVKTGEAFAAKLARLPITELFLALFLMGVDGF